MGEANARGYYELGRSLLLGRCRTCSSSRAKSQRLWSKHHHYREVVPGTVMHLTLQHGSHVNWTGDKAGSPAVSVRTRVVSQNADNVRVVFVCLNKEERHTLRKFLHDIERVEMTLTPRRMSASRGGSLVEFALILPILFVLIVGAVNFAGFYYAFVSVGNAARAAGDYMIMGSAAYSGVAGDGSSLGTLTPPAAQAVANLLGADGAALANVNSLSVRVCTLNPSNGNIANRACTTCSNGGGNMTCAAGDGSFASNPAPDSTTGEGASYVLAWSDVAYTYQPFVPVFPLSSAVNPNPFGASPTIHRQSVFRMLQ
jgi:Flp pilus assembly protein TadG